MRLEILIKSIAKINKPGENKTFINRLEKMITEIFRKPDANGIVE